MDASQFSQINTTISVKERELITPEQFEKLLQAPDPESLVLLLQTSSYHLSAADLEDLNLIERQLTSGLAREYAWAFVESPDRDIVSLFALRYVYHNIKVFFKARATKQELKHLLIPIGSESLEALEHLISTFSSDNFPEFMVDELAMIWAEYEDYKDIRVLEIGTDLAYFKHLKRLANQIELESEVFSQAISLMIDFYNVITVQRALSQEKPQSFMMQLLSDEGSLPAKDFIGLVQTGDLISWFNQINPDSFNTAFASFEEKMRQGSISAVDLEYLYDLVQFQLLDPAKYTAEGPLVLARYLLCREFEVKNLRLLLSAISNQLPLELVKERMRPIYGQ
ncbi:V-type ATPase subunit [Streptococcus ratti]|uniref:V-type ATP synthase subunit C n=1 Tax=Streptococcus ratti TaxID=1341 RepID=A0A7X9QGQ3_STRRT|nr:V-type ATPase subunit [Streptococcus ratti]NMD48954.1 V-type ATP synthase subunit C [Streptococcus ratti]